jgi:hypothetical protein
MVDTLLSADSGCTEGFRGVSATFNQRLIDTHFLGRLSRPQIVATAQNCQRISTAVKFFDRPSRDAGD